MACFFIFSPGHEEDERKEVQRCGQPPH
jgi:hypothetical protein